MTMDVLSSPFSPRKSRLGFHYFPDTFHYTENDLQTWLPELKSLGATWLVVQAPVDRAIPEYFVRGLVDHGIEPLVQFNLPLLSPPDLAGLRPLLAAYQHWGVTGLLWYDRVNARRSWPAYGWAQQGLVERFLDRFLPLANLSLQNGLCPILPALEPGGSYWDTAFLRSTLESIERRKQTQLLDQLVLSGYCWTGDQSLNRGAGGPERWPEARPYRPRSEQQDQRGFRIGDWYGSIAKAVLGKACPVILLGAGAPSDPQQPSSQPHSSELHAQVAVAIANLLAHEPAQDPYNPQDSLEPLIPEVIACNFWLLSAPADSPSQGQAWFPSEGEPLPAVEHLKALAAQAVQAGAFTAATAAKIDPAGREQSYEPAMGNHPIRHYLLLPIYEFGVADWHLNVIRPFVKKYRPTVGFSLAEAALAARVTVLGDAQAIPEEVLEKLRQAGSLVERITGDGTSIATQFLER